MHVLLAPNAFKGSFGAVEVSAIWAASRRGMRGVEVVERPLTDGGDGFVAVVRHYRPEVLAVLLRVPDARGRAVDAEWGWDPARRTAWVESAAAIGLARLAPAERDPLTASSAGLGHLLRGIAGLGVRRIVLGLGGSATVDGGWGMARALGFRFADARGREIKQPADLGRLERITAPPQAPLAGVQVIALADVTNPLVGPRGAAAVFGPQKGAHAVARKRLDTGLSRLAARWTADLGAPADLAERRGAGAAGGLGAGCVAFLGAQLTSGAAWAARLAGLSGALAAADLVVTGEGRFDAQSAGGKAVGLVLSRARRTGVPAAVICARAEISAGPMMPDGRESSPHIFDARALGLPADATLGATDLAALFRLAVNRFRNGR